MTRAASKSETDRARPRRRRRDDLVDTALGLFYRDGFHATGIDRILAEAGVAKMTLYKNFRSKDELILAALSQRDAQYCAWLRERVEQGGGSARARLLRVFDALGEWFEGRPFKGMAFHGCAFIKAAAEFGAADDPIHCAAAAHKQRIVDYLEELAREADAANPRALAEQLALLKEGAIVAAQVRGTPQAAAWARDAAATLIAAACPAA